jgi:energy-coupling factor transporter ATP-binding protein EcfA2
MQVDAVKSKSPKQQLSDALLILAFAIPLIAAMGLSKFFKIEFLTAIYWVIGLPLASGMFAVAFVVMKRRKKLTEVKGPKLRLGTWAKKSWLDRSPFFELGLRNFRHILITGVTGCGKSTLIRRMLGELNRLKRGFLYIDFKGEEREIQEIIENIRAENRENEFQIFDLSRPEVCATRNLLTIFPNVEETVGFVMEIFNFDHPFFKEQAEMFIRNSLFLFDAARELRSFENMMRVLKNEDYRQSLLQSVDVALHTHDFFQYFAVDFAKLDSRSKEERFCGLASKLSPLLSGPIRGILNARESTFDINRLFDSNRPAIIRVPGEAYGDLSKNIVQAFINALPVLISRRRTDVNPKDFFVFMDEQCSYTSDKILAILKKAGSARVHCVLTRQCDGDFESQGTGFLSQIVSTCTTHFIFKIGDARTRDSIAKHIGTVKATKSTKRLSQGSETGEESLRDVHEFKVSPDELADLPKGQCVFATNETDYSFHRRIKVLQLENQNGEEQ